MVCVCTAFSCLLFIVLFYVAGEFICFAYVPKCSWLNEMTACILLQHFNKYTLTHSLAHSPAKRTWLWKRITSALHSWAIPGFWFSFPCAFFVSLSLFLSFRYDSLSYAFNQYCHFCAALIVIVVTVVKLSMKFGLLNDSSPLFVSINKLFC